MAAYDDGLGHAIRASALREQCRVRGCPNVIAYRITTTTNREGKAAACLYRCRVHAREWAQRYGLEIPPEVK